MPKNIFPPSERKKDTKKARSGKERAYLLPHCGNFCLVASLRQYDLRQVQGVWICSTLSLFPGSPSMNTKTLSVANATLLLIKYAYGQELSRFGPHRAPIPPRLARLFLLGGRRLPAPWGHFCLGQNLVSDGLKAHDSAQARHSQGQYADHKKQGLLHAPAFLGND